MLSGWHDVAVLTPDERAVIDAVLSAIVFAALVGAWRMTMTARKHRAQMRETVDKLVETVDQQGKTIVDIDTRMTRLFPNGRNTEDPGDLIARIAEALGVIPPKEHE